MKFSIITPTAERETYLILLYEVIQSQKEEWEWLIYDNSWRRSSFFENLNDSRVKYFHFEDLVTIGEKRNFLKKHALGDVIVHFDDDDYYSPNYLTKVAKEIEGSDFLTFTSWFCYESASKHFFYWSTHEILDTHFVLNPLTGGKIRELDLGAKWKEEKGQDFMRKCATGYGFSYAYRKTISDSLSFEAVNQGEDVVFFEKIEKNAFKTKLLPDEEGCVLHIIHEMNTSLSFPQYRLPPFLGSNIFHHAKDYLARYPHSLMAFEVSS